MGRAVIETMTERQAETIAETRAVRKREVVLQIIFASGRGYLKED